MTPGPQLLWACSWRRWVVREDDPCKEPSFSLLGVQGPPPRRLHNLSHFFFSLLVFLSASAAFAAGLFTPSPSYPVLCPSLSLTVAPWSRSESPQDTRLTKPNHCSRRQTTTTTLVQKITTCYAFTSPLLPILPTSPRQQEPTP